mmetsp:Transcript_56867/g.151830  ORF Transcript_56867/g.151830 Transcript_56867/m.151830 type:complete len:209 (+) Transcript_56867:1283-1909(+)
MQKLLQIVVQALMFRDQDGIALCVESWSTRPAEDLLHIQYTQVLEAAMLGIEDGRTLDDHRSRGQIDTPCQRRRTTEHWYDTIEEHLLSEIPVCTEHACMVHAETVLEEDANLSVPRLSALLLPIAPFFVRVPGRKASFIPLLGQLLQGVGCLERVTTRVNEDHALVPVTHLIHHRVVADLRVLCISAKIVLLGNTDEGRFQGNGTVA